MSRRDLEGLGRPLRGPCVASGAAVCEPHGTPGLLAGEEGGGVESDGPAAWLACSRPPVGTLEPQGLWARAGVGRLVLASQGLAPLKVLPGGQASVLGSASSLWGSGCWPSSVARCGGAGGGAVCCQRGGGRFPGGVCPFTLVHLFSCRHLVTGNVFFSLNN